MYCSAEACIVYGFNFGNRSSKFDSDWLDTNYPNIIENYLGETKNKK